MALPSRSIVSFAIERIVSEFTENSYYAF